MTEIPPLTDQQTATLQAIYDYFHENAAWPKFITIDRPIRRACKWNTAVIVQSLPESLIVPPRQGLHPVADDELRLRLLGIDACVGGSEDTARFVRLLRFLAEREAAYEPVPDTAENMPHVTSGEIAKHLGLANNSDRLALERLRAMIRLDHWSASVGSIGDSWYVRPGEDIWRFRDVQTVQDIVAAREAWIAEGRPPPPEADDSVQVSHGEQLRLSPPSSGNSTYVAMKVVQAIHAKDGQGKFDVTKLGALVEELNDNYASKRTYAAHALLRAILDHIPPAFGYTSFREIANNYSWTQTDKRYMKKLADFRDQADDALHRQISTKADVLSFDDMPPSVCLNRLLQECAERL